MMRIRTTALSGSVLVLALSGCGTAEKDVMPAAGGADVSGMQASIKSLEDGLRARDARIAELEAMGSKPAMAASGSADLPPGAKPGECYARAMSPPKYETETKKLVKAEASEEISVVPAKYQWVEEKILVTEASERLETVPAKYDTVSERVLVKPAHTTWKKGTGPIQRIDDATGEIMCLVEVPAEYRTITKRVQVQPAATRKVAIPAEYKTVRVKKMVEAPREVRKAIPATYQNVTERRLVSPGVLQWHPILCETNTTPNVISQLQSKLRSSGYKVGSVDGVLGAQTMSAVSEYQRKNGLASGKLTIETLRKLGVL